MPGSAPPPPERPALKLSLAGRTVSGPFRPSYLHKFSKPVNSLNSMCSPKYQGIKQLKEKRKYKVYLYRLVAVFNFLWRISGLPRIWTHLALKKPEQIRKKYRTPIRDDWLDLMADKNPVNSQVWLKSKSSTIKFF